MDNLQIFKNESFGSVRTVEENGRVLFCGKDVAEALGYAVPRKALLDHCKGVLKRNTLTTGGVQEMSFIPEGDVYRLITHSKLPSAERFERWVFDEVLPTIRKQKSYGFENMQQIISLTVAETVKRLLPLMNQGVNAAETEEIVITRKRKKTPGIIERLPNDLRRVVDDMICSDNYTYNDVVETLADEGIKITTTSVWRYAKRYF